MNIEEIAKLLNDRKITTVARETGISEPTIRAIRDGSRSVRLYTLERLAKYLARTSPTKDGIDIDG